MPIPPGEPFRVVRQFEEALAEYTGAPFAVTVDSCTNAIFLALLWDTPALLGQHYGDPLKSRAALGLPRRTYVGVARAVINAGHNIVWLDDEWEGRYRIRPTHVVDAAKQFTAGMYTMGDLVCVSFQAYKHLPIGRGGAILCDWDKAAEWLRRARFDGRDPDKEDTGQEVGYHMYLDPPSAARGLWLMRGLTVDNKDLPNDHVDISGYHAFKRATWV